jgi:hypothetical protein
VFKLTVYFSLLTIVNADGDADLYRKAGLIERETRRYRLEGADVSAL